jgi:hypothetical protein
VPPTLGVRDLTIRLLRVHSLRAADALQLAAAITVAEGRPSSLEFVTLQPAWRRRRTGGLPGAVICRRSRLKPALPKARLAALELRLALLQEGLHAFAMVLGLARK